jgi:hypothetical protein
MFVIVVIAVLINLWLSRRREKWTGSKSVIPVTAIERQEAAT